MIILGGIAGFVLAGAFKGALIGAISSGLIGATIGCLTTGSWSGAIMGGITRAASNGIKVLQASKAWISTSTKSSLKVMSEHYVDHVLREGQQAVTKNIVNYTRHAKEFFTLNQALGVSLREGVIKNAGAPGGIFNIDGLITSFLYILMP